jgi:hypothetical protein
MLPAVILATVAVRPAWAQPDAARQQEIALALDQYAAAKTPGQRATVVEYLQHMDRKVVAGAVVDHIIASRTGTEATTFNELLATLNPDGCAAALDRLMIADEPIAKGKLIVALRHCQGEEAIQALAGCLDDTRPVHFETHGANPRRICDLAYDELFLKLRSDPRYGLDSSPRMHGVISEKTPVKTRTALIVKLKSALAAKSPTPTPSPSATPSAEPSARPPAAPSATPTAPSAPSGPKPATAAITL